MSSASKLTKKQKKALAFRARHSKASSDALGPEDNAFPIAEDQDIVEHEEPLPKLEDKKTSTEPRIGEGKKRKREPVKAVGTSPSEQPQPKSKKRKIVSGEEDGAGTSGGSEEVAAKPAKKEKSAESKVDAKQRFILFVGNLKFTTTREAVESHFSACDPPPTVRLMTPKPSASGKSTAKSKGFAFVEFVNKVGLQQALRLHHTELEGRKINVELTAGGGGKSEGRLSKLKERNKELHEQRTKRLAKQRTKKETGESGTDVVEKPTRYSTTSGIGQTPSTKRTWTVGDVVEEKKTKKRGSKKRPPKPQGTGVNAIPVG